VRPEESDLYGLPLEEFVPARTELERRLRKEGDRERAAAVKKLTKPSVAAWAVNQASRSQPKHRRELLEASAELRATQERLIAGDASARDLESAGRRQRAALDALVDAASGLLTGDGKALGDATLARVRETLAAVASDEELADLFEAGTVDRERRPAGLGFGFGGPAVEATAAPAKAPGKKAKAASTDREQRKPGRKAEDDRKRGDADRKAREKAEKRRKRELAAARERVKDAKTEARAAERRQKAAERDARRAGQELERAESALAEARERAAEALRAAEEAAAEAERAAQAAGEAAAELDDLAAADPA
jgi:hypothetical protein